MSKNLVEFIRPKSQNGLKNDHKYGRKFLSSKDSFDLKTGRRSTRKIRSKSFDQAPNFGNFIDLNSGRRPGRKTRSKPLDQEARMAKTSDFKSSRNSNRKTWSKLVDQEAKSGHFFTSTQVEVLVERPRAKLFNKQLNKALIRP